MAVLSQGYCIGYASHMIVELSCDQNVNPEKIVVEEDFNSIREFVKRLYANGFNINDRIVVDWDSKPGKILCYSYPPPMWHQTMMTMRLTPMLECEYQNMKNLRNTAKARGTAKMRRKNPVTGEMESRELSPTELAALMSPPDDVPYQASEGGILLP